LKIITYTAVFFLSMTLRALAEVHTLDDGLLSTGNVEPRFAGSRKNKKAQLSLGNTRYRVQPIQFLLQYWPSRSSKVN